MSQQREKYYVVVRFANPYTDQALGNGHRTFYRVWRYYDPYHVWDSPAYEVCAYFNNRADAQQYVRTRKQRER